MYYGIEWRSADQSTVIDLSGEYDAYDETGASEEAQEQLLNRCDTEQEQQRVLAGTIEAFANTFRDYDTTM